LTNKIHSLLILLHCQGLGRATIRKLLDQFGSPEKILEQGWNRQNNLLFDKWQITHNWEIDFEMAEKAGVGLISYCDASFPINLRSLPDSPLLLYVKGKLTPPAACNLAIIGTRNATLYGKQTAEKIAQDIAASGVCVVSGLARGIDTAAHEGALKGGGTTIAVIGSGLSKIYPQENHSLAEKIGLSGAVISEFPMEMPPAKGLFPQRNRIVSGLADGICLIESPLTGGGMITMEIAQQQKKPLFALPGRVDWPTFEGNHLLLKHKKAHLIENGSDLLKYFNITRSVITKNSLLTREEGTLLALLASEEKSIEELVLLTQLPIMQLNVLLTRLILKKVVKEFPGKIYKKNI